MKLGSETRFADQQDPEINVFLPPSAGLLCPRLLSWIFKVGFRDPAQIYMLVWQTCLQSELSPSLRIFYILY